MTDFEPGDVVISTEIRHLWWVHGLADIELLITNTAGLCLSIPEAEERFGDLVLYCRPSDHQPVRGSGERR